MARPDGANSSADLSAVVSTEAEALSDIEGAKADATDVNDNKQMTAGRDNKIDKMEQQQQQLQLGGAG